MKLNLVDHLVSLSPLNFLDASHSLEAHGNWFQVLFLFRQWRGHKKVIVTFLSSAKYNVLTLGHFFGKNGNRCHVMLHSLKNWAQRSRGYYLTSENCFMNHLLNGYSRMYYCFLKVVKIACDLSYFKLHSIRC